VFQAAAQYLDTYGDPPAGNGADAEQWWAKAADALCGFGNTHENHPLALKLGVALYEYIEIKAKAKGEAHHETVHR